jgi:hypothetical protein
LRLSQSFLHSTYVPADIFFIVCRCRWSSCPVSCHNIVALHNHSLLSKLLFCNLRHTFSSPKYTHHVNIMSQCTWAPDFCLFCDKQVTTDDAYCSQACRLEDYEKGQAFKTNFSSDSSSTTDSVSSQTTSSASGYPSITQFSLPPAFNFEQYRKQSTYYRRELPSYSPKTTTSKSSSSGYQMHVPPMRPTLPYRATYDHSMSKVLNNSSSRSSLASTNSGNSNYQGWEGLTGSVATQLREYAELVRQQNRRTTLG